MIWRRHAAQRVRPPIVSRHFQRPKDTASLSHLFAYESALNRRTAQTVGLFSIQKTDWIQKAVSPDAS